ncbi:nitrate reductase NapE component [Paenibacillus jamilae]|nr:nitrate reductase NapE component [Paenibacillus jamilae]
MNKQWYAKRIILISVAIYAILSIGISITSLGVAVKMLTILLGLAAVHSVLVLNLYLSTRTTKNKKSIKLADMTERV